MRDKFQKIVDSRFGRTADKFCNSVWYIVAIGVVVVLGHTCNIPVVGAALLTVLLVPALLFCKNSFVLTPFLLMCAFVLSEETKPETGYYNTPLKISVLCILLIAILLSLAFNLIYYGKWKKIFKRSYLTVSLAILTAALLFGGVGSDTLSWSGFGISVSVAVTMFLPYALIVNCGEYEGRKTVEYFAYSVIVAALAIGVGIVQKYIVEDLSINGGYIKDKLKLGFVGPNTGAAIVTLAIPMTFYLVYVYDKGFAFVPLIGVELLIILLTVSRASLVVALPGTAIVAVWLCFKKKNGRTGYLIAFGIAVLAVLAVAVVFRGWIYDKLVKLFAGDVTGSGRTKLWKSGFEAWKKSPVFGVCMSFLHTTGHWYYSFHCTPLTYLFCTGIVGLAAYLYHRYKTVRLVFSAKLTAERTFVALCGLAMLCNALLDIAMTSPTHLLYYGIMLAIIECDAKRTKAESSVENTQTVDPVGDGANIEADNENV